MVDGGNDELEMEMLLKAVLAIRLIGAYEHIIENA
jgi:hypothetical protein